MEFSVKIILSNEKTVNIQLWDRESKKFIFQ